MILPLRLQRMDCDSRGTSSQAVKKVEESRLWACLPVLTIGVSGASSRPSISVSLSLSLCLSVCLSVSQSLALRLRLRRWDHCTQQKGAEALPPARRNFAGDSAVVERGGCVCGTVEIEQN